MRVMDIACQNSIGRIQKCATIMGRKEEDSLKVSQLFYPCMQCADIFSWMSISVNWELIKEK